MRTRKPSRDFKGMLQTIKRFIAGEDISDEVLGWSRHLDKLSAAQLNEFLRIKNSGEPLARQKEMLKESGILDTLEGKPQFTWFKVCSVDDPENMKGKPSWFVGPGGDRYEIDGKACSQEAYEQRLATEKAKGGFVWQETRKYKNSETSEQIEHSEPIETPNSDDLSTEAVKPRKKKEARKTPVMTPKSHTDILKEKLEAYDKEFQENLNEHQKNKELAEANNILNVHIIRMLQN